MTEEEVQERVRRAIAHLTQVREELMCEEVYSFLEGSDDQCSIVASKAGMLRCSLQMYLRKLKLKEVLDDESVEGIIKSRMRESQCTKTL